MNKEIQSLLMNNTTQESIKIIERLLEDEGRTINLKCIDTNNYVKGDHFHMHKNEVNTQDFKHRISTNTLTVDHINNHNDYVVANDENEIKYYIPFNKLKYFRMSHSLTKDEVKEHILDEVLELIKKSNCKITHMDNDYIKIKFKNNNLEFGFNDLLDRDKLLEALRRIELLHRPFVIASESDLYNIKDGSYGLLSNGSRFEVESSMGGHYDKVKVLFLLDYDSKENVKVDFDKLTEVHELDYNVLRGSKIYPIRPSKNDSFWD